MKDHLDRRKGSAIKKVKQQTARAECKMRTDGLSAKRSDGRQFVSLLDHLEQTSKQASGGIFSTHPDLAERIQAAKGPCAAAARPPAPDERIVRFKKTAISW